MIPWVGVIFRTLNTHIPLQVTNSPAIHPSIVQYAAISVAMHFGLRG